MSMIATTAKPSDRAFERQDFRQALGKFPTGVAIITARDPQGTPLGRTVNSFTSVSLDPALVLWCLRRESKCFGGFSNAAFFAVHLLAATQQDLSSRFTGNFGDPFVGLTVANGIGSVPLLDGGCARFECKTVSHYDGGDHIIFVGEVMRFDTWERSPLLYYQGQYRDVYNGNANHD